MDLIAGLVLFLGATTIFIVLGWDIIQNRKQITKVKIQQSSAPMPSNQLGLIRTLFNRS